MLFAPFKAQGVHIASLTVVPQIRPGSAQVAAAGEHSRQLHVQARDAWTDEATQAG